MGQFRKTQCGFCGERFSVGTEWAGRKVQCPTCQETTMVVFPGKADGADATPPAKGGTAVKVVLIVAAVALAAALAYCAHRLAQTTADRDAALQNVARMAEDKAKADKALAESKAALEKLRAENDQLKRTARHYLDLAVDAMKAAEAANDNKADNGAIAKYEEVARRFPDDPLAGAAWQAIDDLKARIRARDAAVARAQVEVAGLVGRCRSDATIAAQIRARSIMYTRVKELDMNMVAAGGREAEQYDRTAKAYRGRARELLTSVPDPDGSMAKQVDGCNVP